MTRGKKATAGGGKRKSSTTATPVSTPTKKQRVNPDNSNTPSANTRSSKSSLSSEPLPSHSKRKSCQPKSAPKSPPPKQSPCSCSSSNNNGPESVEEIGDPIIKSPLDTHGYKMVRLQENGLKALLVSTCLHPRDLEIDNHKSGKETKSNCTFRKIVEFNETHANFKTKSGSEKKVNSTVNFSKASAEQEKATKAKRKRAAKRKQKQRKVKCRQGVHELDDEMQDFCNNKCIAVLFIKAGFFQDPLDFPGMAHFCEHVITLGSKNFPELEALTKFVEAEGGVSNARTDYEYTAFFFYVDHEHIDHSLEIFVDVLSHPSFSQKDIPKEIENIDSEFEGKRTVDEIRQFALFQSCVVEGHPASNFGMGNKESITGKGKVNTDEIMNRLLDWMGRYYCTENMLFAIQGPKSLVELEQLFAKHFSKVPNKFRNLPSSSCPIPNDKDPALLVKLPPIDFEKWNKMYHMAAAGDNKFMTVSWSLDPKFGRDYETKPVNYFSYILCKTEVGSLVWYLKQKGWLITLHVNYPGSAFFSTDYYTLFSIFMELTAEGLKERMSVLRAVFSYIALLREEGASEMIFDEVRQLHSDIFHYRSDMNLSDPTIGRKFDDSLIYETFFQVMQTFVKTGCSSKVLLDTFLVTKYDPQVLDEFVDCLQPSNVMVVYASASFAKDADEEEKWYKARYYTKPICKLLIDQLERLRPYPDFQFPKANPFVSVSSCSPDEKSSKDGIEKQSGILNYQSDKGLVTYGNKKCRKGLLPSAEYTIIFMSPVMEDDMDSFNAPCLDVFIAVLKYILDIKLGRALSSLISYHVELREFGSLTVILSGPSPKLPQLANIVIDTLQNFGEHVQGQTIVSEMIRNMAGLYRIMMSTPEDCANNLLAYILNDRISFLSDIVHVLENNYDAEDFQLFAKDFTTRLFVEADLDGCVTKSQASEVAQHLDQLDITPYMRKTEYGVFSRAIRLPDGERCLLVSAKNKEDRNVAVINYYQVGEVDEHKHAMLRAIYLSLTESAFGELRTKQNLGYFLDVDRKEFGGIPGIKIFIQGTADTHTCGYINEQIDAYLMTVYKTSFASQKTFTNDILVWSKEDQDIKLSETKKFFEAHFLPEGSQYRKLSIQIQGHKKSPSSKPSQPKQIAAKVAKYSSGKKLSKCGTGPEGGSCGVSTFSDYLDLCLDGVKEENGYFITDILKFKDSRPCFGNMEEEVANFSDVEDGE